MKKLMICLMIVLMSAMASTPAGAKTEKKSVTEQMPKNLVVKQTTEFTDGRTLTIYYKKEGLQCEVYSPCDAKDYDLSDAQKIKSTNFERVDRVEGKLYRKASLGEVTRLLKRLVNKYL
ncbi:MAG: hypothetical protein IJ604_01135 [Prevotella sp.]|nr:hypothetical protein [Prevotella sp.]